MSQMPARAEASEEAAGVEEDTVRIKRRYTPRSRARAETEALRSRHAADQAAAEVVVARGQQAGDPAPVAVAAPVPAPVALRGIRQTAQEEEKEATQMTADQRRAMMEREHAELRRKLGLDGGAGAGWGGPIHRNVQAHLDSLDQARKRM